MSTFSDRLKELRKTKNITQKTLASTVGITERAYQDLEYGKFKPNHDNIVSLANSFQVSTDYLLGLTDNPERQ